MGRTLDNALLNLGLKQQYSEGIDKLGFNLEDIIHQERDAGLGNGGLGRLAACYLDSSASQELPVWGYGLRYKYGACSFALYCNCDTGPRDATNARFSVQVSSSS